MLNLNIIYLLNSLHPVNKPEKYKILRYEQKRNNYHSISFYRSTAKKFKKMQEN